MRAPLLLELGTEELPPKALAALVRAFADGVAAGLVDAGLAIGAVRPLGSPRRLAVRIDAVADRTPEQTVERLGPAVAGAFDTDGQPTKAATGFARSCGVTVDALERRATAKGERLAYRGVAAGRKLAQLLPEVFAAALKGLPVPKYMRWGSSDEAFVRPVHWLVALHGADILPLQAFGCTAGRRSYGHRFRHPEGIDLPDADVYIERLREPGRVLVDMSERRTNIERQVTAAAAGAGGEALLTDDLLDEVNALVEWPVALAGSFEDRFSALPREVLVATLEGHQRYFPVAGGDGALLPRFIAVANIDSSAPEQVLAGNERVVRPRLADALFFWEQDRKRGLVSYAADLNRVTFQRDLGSVADKMLRVTALARRIATALGAAAPPVERACALAKADLLSDMVGEFPELQGTMGRYYAAAAGEDDAVAVAIGEQYAPRQAGAAIAATAAGRILALADKLDTLAGVFALGRQPTGDKDPFALRRAALGVLRTVIEGGLDLDLPALLDAAVAAQPPACDHVRVSADLLDFHGERLRGYYAERGVPGEVFESVLALGLHRPADFDRRIQAVQAFLAVDAAGHLCGAHKRIRNILKDASGDSVYRQDLLSEPAEVALGQALADLSADVAARRERGDYRGALLTLAELQRPVDRFFDEVLVMSEDAAVRRNRLALLGVLDALCRSVADISRLTPALEAA